MTRYKVLFLFFLICLMAMAQTPEQSYFEWTTMPFSKEELAQRRENLLKNIAGNGLVLIPAKDGYSDGETFRQSDDFYYFTGLELPNSILVMDLANNTVLIYVPEQDLRFHSTSRPNDFPGRQLLKDSEIQVRSGLELKNIEEFPFLMDSIIAENRKLFLNKGAKGGFAEVENNYIYSPSPIETFIEAIRKKHRDGQFENIYESVAKVRMVKSPSEIKIMRKVTAINIKGIASTAKAIEAGIDERHLEGILEGNYKINGAQRLAFGSIIKSGPNSLWPWRILATHYDRRNRVLKNGELVILDVGCEYQHYVSDVGRTFPVSGKFSKTQKEVLNMEVSIADQIIDFIRPGITFSDIKNLTDSIIPKKAAKYMQVGLHFGHHLGLSAGDPSLPNAILQPGMIFTVEPWYYNHDDNISVFIEDVILVTEKGCEVLSKDLPRTPEQLENLMNR